LVWFGIEIIPLQTSEYIYNELQNSYTKEKFQKVPENPAGSQHWLDIPTTF